MRCSKLQTIRGSREQRWARSLDHLVRYHLRDQDASVEEKDCPIHIYHLGDFDPSGVNAGEKIEEDLCEFAPDLPEHASCGCSSRRALR